MKTDEFGLPEAPIKLSGFPTCAHPSRDGREVEKAGDFCAQDGGKPASMEILRRSMHREIRMAIRQMQLCGDCAVIPINEIRCHRCTWMRGAAMGIAGVGEQLGWAEELEPYMRMIGHFDPGWQKKAFV